MTAMPAAVVDIKGNSLDDGPGIRSVVFLQGCPLNCSWCHNPEAIAARPQLVWKAEHCEQYADCVAACHQQAIRMTPAWQIDPDVCDHGMRCVESCATGAIQPTGKYMSVADIIATLAPWFHFHETSGGGVTLSGGEPLMHMVFCGQLLRELRSAGAHTLVETGGHFSFELFQKYVAQWTNQIYFDLKLADDAAHRQHCGRTNTVILENFRKLARMHRAGKLAVRFRIPLVPDITATDDNLKAIAALLREADITTVDLLPYNPLWKDKALSLGRPLQGQDRWMSAQEIQRCRGHFLDQGIACH